jgi:hypothetical protein
MRYAVFLSVAVLLGTPALAQPPAAPSAPAIAQPDPARMAITRRIAALLFPDGTYRKVMDATLSTLTETLLSNMNKMSVRDLAAAGGLPAGDIEKMSDGSLGEAMAILDPAYNERQKIVTQVMFAEMTTLIVSMEPELREGMAEAMAARFSSEQLVDIEKFMQTPSGSAFAGQYALMGTDPAMMRRVNAMMPKLMTEIPGILKKATAATSGLPKPKTYQELDPAAQKRFDALLGIKPPPRKRRR